MINSGVLSSAADLRRACRGDAPIALGMAFQRIRFEFPARGDAGADAYSYSAGVSGK